MFKKKDQSDKKLKSSQGKYDNAYDHARKELTHTTKSKNNLNDYSYDYQKEFKEQVFNSNVDNLFSTKNSNIEKSKKNFKELNASKETLKSTLSSDSSASTSSRKSNKK